jgi:hypothetical protein
MNRASEETAGGGSKEPFFMSLLLLVPQDTPTARQDLEWQA